ncbi:MAG: 50S ribosomal protein L18 [Bacteroidota bacterium]|nr:50S ribosomal protein L18 [Bacteroidota bacterium]MDX5431424.1 50S ribosomal protein L18 [Bacteroidota bacterium]MDX5470152.1 50S ribosomal protein L18 [Bacteroidota bacterium]
MIRNKVFKRKKIKARVRGKVSGTATCPRLSVFRSNKQIYAQLIDDTTGRTLVAASSRIDAIDKAEGNKVDKSFKVGQELAAKAIQAGITQVVFDRNGYLYHGRVKNLAEGAREGGLIF